MTPLSFLRAVLAIVREVVPLFRKEPKAPARTNVTKPPIDPHEAKDVERITAKRRAMKPRRP